MTSLGFDISYTSRMGCVKGTINICEDLTPPINIIKNINPVTEPQHIINQSKFYLSTFENVLPYLHTPPIC